MPQEHVLITGATGLLGGAVLFDALQSQPEIAWTALVRAGSEGQARARIAARLARFGGTATAIRLAERVQVIPGTSSRCALPMPPPCPASPASCTSPPTPPTGRARGTGA